MKKFLYRMILIISIIGLSILWPSGKSNMHGYSLEPMKLLADADGSMHDSDNENNEQASSDDGIEVELTGSEVTFSSDDTIQFLLTGYDKNLSKENSADLTLEANASKIKIKVAGEEVTPTTKSVSTTTSGDETVIYYLTLKGVTGRGQLSITLDEGILQDKKANKSPKTTFKTKVSMEQM